MTNLTAARVRKCLALAVSELELDNLEASASAAVIAGALHHKVSPLVCDIEIPGEAPAVVAFLLSYVVDGWNAARDQAVAS